MCHHIPSSHLENFVFGLDIMSHACLRDVRCLTAGRKSMSQKIWRQFICLDTAWKRTGSWISSVAACSMNRFSGHLCFLQRWPNNMGKMSVHLSVRPFVRRYVHNGTQCSYEPIDDIGRGRLGIHDDITFKVTEVKVTESRIIREWPNLKSISSVILEVDWILLLFVIIWTIS